MHRGIKLDALDRLHELGLRHATEEQREKLRQITGGMAPNGSISSAGYKQPAHDVFTDEATAILMEHLCAEVADLRAMITAVLEPPAIKRGDRRS